MNKKPSVLNMLVTIVDRDKVQKIVDILSEKQVHAHFITYAEGTAASEMMEMLGLTSKEKGVVCCIEPTYRIPGLLALISERLELHKPGKGIAFTSRLSGVSGAVLKMVTQNEKSEEAGSEDKMEKANPVKYELILSVVNQGYAEVLMDAAKKASAKGGTILHGRKIGVDENATSFFGMSMQAEKQIIAILTPKGQKHDIMLAISNTCGLTTDAQGIVFSLPIDEIEGLGQ